MSAFNMLANVFGANYPQQGMAFQQRMPRQFIRKYHAYSPAYWNSENREKLESGLLTFVCILIICFNI